MAKKKTALRTLSSPAVGASVGDKILNWEDVYTELNRIINLPKKGAATNHNVVALNVNDVGEGTQIDDTDKNNFNSKYNALKADELFSSATQLDPTTHEETTVSLFTITPTNVTEGTVVTVNNDTEVRSIMQELAVIQCRNKVYCSERTEVYCSNRSSYTACSQSYYTACYQGSYQTGYVYSCSPVTAWCSQSYCRHRLYYSSTPCSETGCACQSSSEMWDCGGFCNNQRTVTYQSYYNACSQSYYTAYTGCNQTYTTGCNNQSHNDILCNNTSWTPPEE